MPVAALTHVDGHHTPCIGSSRLERQHAQQADAHDTRLARILAAATVARRRSPGAIDARPDRVLDVHAPQERARMDEVPWRCPVRASRPRYDRADVLAGPEIGEASWSHGKQVDGEGLPPRH